MPSIKRKKQLKQENLYQNAINLLPKDVRISEGIRGKAKKFKQMSISIALFFVVLSISLLIYNYYLDNQTKKLQTESANLKANIEALEGTEQRLVLYRDRILKLQTLLAAQDVNSTLPIQEDTIDQIQNVELESAKLSEVEQSIGVSSEFSRNIKDYLLNIEQLPYQRLTLKDITFSNVAGFQAEFTYSKP